jgi:EAL domain-containing protein (putative c-di-GMP-specific phosphodiesterase class I)
MENDHVSAAMVESVNQIGHVMGLETIAEFVETAEARALLEKMGIDYLQGYLLGKPCPLSEVLAAYEKQPSIAAV